MSDLKTTSSKRSVNPAVSPCKTCKKVSCAEYEATEERNGEFQAHFCKAWSDWFERRWGSTCDFIGNLKTNLTEEDVKKREDLGSKA